MENELFTQVKENRAYLVELRREFHRNAEASFKEYKTASRIEAELLSMGIASKRIGETGVWGVIKGAALPESGRGSKKIVLRADIDALPIQDEKDEAYRSQNPGVMHACGHDAHAASLLGAAKVLKAREKQFSGEVGLVFQQAEELGGGARQFIRAGALEGAERVLGIHMASDLPVGKIGIKPGVNNASVDYFKISVQGKSAHVSTPHLGSDALYAASQIVVGLQGLVTRRTSPIDTVLIGIGVLRSGTAYNIVAETAELEGTLRTVSAALRESIKREIEELACHYAAISASTVSFEWKDFASPLVNDEAVSAEAAETARSFAGDANVIQDRPLSLGGDDFAEFLREVPGVYAYIGSANSAKPNTTLPHHNCRFDIDEEALVYAAGLYAEYTRRYLGF
jgi:amidohydrolase